MNIKQFAKIGGMHSGAARASSPGQSREDEKSIHLQNSQESVELFRAMEIYVALWNSSGVYADLRNMTNTSRRRE